jgi:hypothetical protein
MAMTTLWLTFHHDEKNQTNLLRMGSARPSPFTISTIMYKVVVFLVCTLLLFPLYPYMFSFLVPIKFENLGQAHYREPGIKHGHWSYPAFLLLQHILAKYNSFVLRTSRLMFGAV